MPPVRTLAYYQRLIYSYAERGLRSPEVARLIKQDADDRGRQDCPSESTVRRLYDRYKARPESDRRGYAEFRWPDSMEGAQLPWDSSDLVLELLAWARANNRPRPTSDFVVWFWRSAKAAPTHTIEDWLEAANWLVERERGRTDTLDRLAEAIEEYLASVPALTGGLSEFVDIKLQGLGVNRTQLSIDIVMQAWQ